MALSLGFFLALGQLVGAVGEHWAVLIAGSRGYGNYRHQADICHAQKVLKARGFDPDKIITLLYDDVANSTRNPFPGKLFNHPSETMEDAVDVNDGCHKDYTHLQVTPETFTAVLTGDAEKAGGKVLKSTADDHVFVNFADHGGVGIICFPQGVLHSAKLIETLKAMHEKGMYKQLVFYLEACESGSMFENLLPDDLPVYAVTAANSHESSWGTYCGASARVAGKYIGSCLGDLFSVNWMNDSEVPNPSETLGEQFKRVQTATSKSHVMHFGEVQTFDGETVDEFQGAERASSPAAPPTSSSVNSRNIDLQHLFDEYERTGSPEAGKRLTQEIQERSDVQALGHRIASKVLGSGEQAKQLLAAPLASGWTPSLLRCHERAVEVFGAKCGWDEKRVVLSKTLFQLCERDSERVLEGVEAACTAEIVI